MPFAARLALAVQVWLGLAAWILLGFGLILPLRVKGAREGFWNGPTGTSMNQLLANQAKIPYTGPLQIGPHLEGTPQQEKTQKWILDAKLKFGIRRNLLQPSSTNPEAP